MAQQLLNLTFVPAQEFGFRMWDTLESEPTRIPSLIPSIHTRAFPLKYLSQQNERIMIGLLQHSSDFCKLQSR